jgi:hypothetical protein
MVRVKPANRMCAIALPAFAVATLLGAAWSAGEHDVRAQAPSPAVPTELHDEGYVGSEACIGCHTRNVETWRASYHRRMTQVAAPDTVLAPFTGTTPVLDGTAWKLSREDDRFFAQPVSADGAPLGRPMRVALMTGSHHYQVYWLELRGAEEMPQLPFVWHVAEQRWVPRKSMFLEPPSPVTGSETGRWPRTCMKCHATNGTMKHQADEHTHVAQFGIACEACHGPGGAHVALERALEKNDPAPSTDDSDTLIVDPKKLRHDRSSQVCGQCHGIHPIITSEEKGSWEHSGFAYRPGDDLARTRELLRGTYERNSAAMRAYLDRNPGTLESTFWSDGEVRVSGREYNGLVDSPCYRGDDLSCLSCHDMHPSRKDAPDLEKWAAAQLRPGMDGSQACVQCHVDFADPERVTPHTHHAVSSSGSDCLNCHMTYTTYGLTKAMRSHTITVPSIAVTLATGRPDACNQCHLDRTLAWAADHLHEWYGQAQPKLDSDQCTIAASILWALEGDEGQRALMAWSYGWKSARDASGTGWMPFVISTLAQDSYDVVRWIAMRTARADPRHAGFTLDFAQPLEQQRDVVRATLLEDWMRDGLKAAPDRRDAVLVHPDGSLDEARFRRLYALRNTKDMSLGE